jgi:hypothetical protein
VKLAGVAKMDSKSSSARPWTAPEISLRLRILSGLALCFAFLLSPTPAAAARGEIHHVVIFWLKHPGNAQDLVHLTRASEKFRTLPGVLRVETGRALPVRRTGIEQPFDLCVIFTFQDRAALKRFEVDPRHLAAVKSVLQPLVKRYAVYNSEAE